MAVCFLLAEAKAKGKAAPEAPKPKEAPKAGASFSFRARRLGVVNGFFFFPLPKENKMVGGWFVLGVPNLSFPADRTRRLGGHSYIPPKDAI